MAQAVGCDGLKLERVEFTALQVWSYTKLRKTDMSKNVQSKVELFIW